MNKAVFFPEYVKGIGSILRPMDQDGVDLIRSLAHCKEKGVMVEIKSARNPKHHRLFFGLVGLIADNARTPITKKAIVAWIKYAVGHVETQIDHKGNHHRVPKSISYESMSQADFNEFFDASIQAVCEGLLEGSDWQEVKNEVLSRCH